MQPPSAQELVLILWRRKAWVAVPVLLGLLGGLIAGRLIPARYRSAAEILIEPPKVAAGLVETITSLSVEARLDAVRRHITARERIEKLITDVDLYPELSQAGLLDEAVRQARTALLVRVGQDNSVKIEFVGRDPERVAAAANRVAEEYVEQNSILRDVESEGTIEFMQAQMEESKKKLEAHEARITRFKADNLMRLPDQRESHTWAVERLQATSATNEDAIASAEMRLALLRQGVRPTEATASPLSPEAKLLAQRRQDLRALRRGFTEEHPDVIRLRKEIAALEEETANAPPAPAPTPDQKVDPVMAAQIVQMEFELEELKIEKRQIQADILRYQRYLEQIPAVEQQLLILDREHENLEGFYGQNLRRRTEIGVAEDLERGDLREGMRIIERAAPASTPFSPNKPLLVMVGLALGGLVGLGLALLRENVDGAFAEPAGLRRAFPGVRVLNAIPRIQAARAGMAPAADPERRSA